MAAKTVGILGGMGPQATNELCVRITALTPAATDQEHIPVICFNNSAIPNRVSAILHGGESAAPEMIRTARILEQAGADMILIPCNCAHYYYPDVAAGVRIPVLNMIEETVRYIIDGFPGIKSIGLLASSATLHCNLYQIPLAKRGIATITPDVRDQKKVMEAIYGTGGLKAGYSAKPQKLLKAAALDLKARGAELVIAACTEISLVLRSSESLPVVDPLDVIALRAVRLALDIEETQELPRLRLLNFDRENSSCHVS